MYLQLMATSEILASHRQLGNVPVDHLFTRKELVGKGAYGGVYKVSRRGDTLLPATSSRLSQTHAAQGVHNATGLVVALKVRSYSLLFGYSVHLLTQGTLLHRSSTWTPPTTTSPKFRRRWPSCPRCATPIDTILHCTTAAICMDTSFGLLWTSLAVGASGHW